MAQDLDFDVMAAEWARSAKKRSSATGDSVNTGSSPPVPQYRMTPDGSAILDGWRLDWGGAQGQASSPVSLRHEATGRVIVQGAAFGALAQQSIQDPVSQVVVWIPNPAYQGAESPPGAQPVRGVPTPNGLSGSSGDGAPSLGRKVLGGGLALLGVGMVGWTGWQLWQAWSSRRGEPELEPAAVADDLDEDEEDDA